MALARQAGNREAATEPAKSRTGALGPTGRRATARIWTCSSGWARSDASTASSWRSGPTPVPTAEKQSTGQLSRSGCTPTNTTADTSHWKGNHPPAASQPHGSVRVLDHGRYYCATAVTARRDSPTSNTPQSAVTACARATPCALSRRRLPLGSVPPQRPTNEQIRPCCDQGHPHEDQEHPGSNQKSSESDQNRPEDKQDRPEDEKKGSEDDHGVLLSPLPTVDPPHSQCKHSARRPLGTLTPSRPDRHMGWGGHGRTTQTSTHAERRAGCRCAGRGRCFELCITFKRRDREPPPSGRLPPPCTDSRQTSTAYRLALPAGHPDLRPLDPQSARSREITALGPAGHRDLVITTHPSKSRANPAHEVKAAGLIIRDFEQDSSRVQLRHQPRQIKGPTTASAGHRGILDTPERPLVRRSRPDEELRRALRAVDHQFVKCTFNLDERPRAHPRDTASVHVLRQSHALGIPPSPVSGLRPSGGLLRDAATRRAHPGRSERLTRSQSVKTAPQRRRPLNPSERRGWPADSSGVFRKAPSRATLPPDAGRGGRDPSAGDLSGHMAVNRRGRSPARHHRKTSQHPPDQPKPRNRGQEAEGRRVVHEPVLATAQRPSIMTRSRRSTHPSPRFQRHGRQLRSGQRSTVVPLHLPEP